MAVALEKFVKQLEDSGIVAPGKLENFVPPKAHPKDAEELARQLVKADHLTPFQAQHVLQGKVKALFLGNYTILDKIGAGGMGQVFKAEHRRMERIVAIKMLPPAMTKNAVALARFQREVKAAARLRHPNIVNADDADEANGAHFLVMEYVEGKDLSAHVKKNGRFSVDKAVNYILQAAKGLEFAHAEGVIHRDIKPANLLLDKKGVVKILDMGLARIDAPGGDIAAQAELTGTGAIMGTVDYMAPEQGVSTKDADARADIYSLGCTLHYLLIGKPVYGGDSVGAKFLAHHNQPIPNLCTLREDVPQQVNAIFRKMVAKKIEDRYQTMTEVIADLQACGLGHDQSLTMQRSISLNTDNSALTFLKNIPAATTHKPKPTKKASSASTGKKKLTYGAVGAGLLGLLILAGIIVSLRTKDGTLIVEIDQPDAMVQVLDEQGKVEVSQQGGVGKVTISVEPGQHRLKVEKDGFAVFGENFEMKLRGKKAITAKLVPVKVVAGAAQPNQPWNTPTFHKWVEETQKLPADKQIEAVSKKLMELNPDFDGKLAGFDVRANPDRKPKVEGEAVTEIGFFSDNVADLSPLRALSKLQHLDCGGRAPGKKGLLSDLSPLTGMRLVKLNCSDSHVADLSPLTGMQLTFFNCGATNVLDLKPLSRMPLKIVFCSMTKVSDLSPLEGMPITDLSIHHALISNLSPLRGMPLKSLNCYSIPATDFTPLEAMSLTDIVITPANVHQGIDILRRMTTLKTIGAGPNKLPTAEFWKKYDAGEFGKPAAPSKLAYLDPAFQQWVKTTQSLPPEKQVEAVAKKLMELNSGFDGKVTGPYGQGTPKIENGVVTVFEFLTHQVTDISPVQALAGLKILTCSGGGRGNGKLSDLSPLKGMSLAGLYCNGTNVYDLSPLEGMKLTALNCSFTQISDLSPLKGMPLTQLSFGASRVSDLSPLQGMPLTRLECYYTQVSDLLALRGMQLDRLNCSGTVVPDLSPLQGMPLTRLVCEETFVSDLSPLQGMKLAQFSFTPKNITKGIEIVRQMKSLKTLGLHETKDTFPATEFWNKYDNGDFGKPVASAKPWESPAFQQWMKDVQALPAEKQVEAVSKKLMELNPGFNGVLIDFDRKGSPKIDKGTVTELGFVTDNVTDISPVRAFVNLTALSCGDSGGYKGQLGDLSPLAGMKLSKLSCGGTKVSDLSPLQGMPLSFFHCNGTQIGSLLPLQGMPLTSLNCGSTHVSDLLPLRGMPLKRLGCYSTKVSDLSPLHGMPLTILDCQRTSVSNLAPLQGMTLTQIALTPKNITEGMNVIRSMNSLKGISLGADQGIMTPDEFWRKYDAGEFGEPAASAKLAYLDPAFQAWMKTVAAMPAEKQVESVAKKLQEINPGFDGKITSWDGKGPPKIGNGVVTEFALVTDNVTDISPIRALTGLKILRCAGSGPTKGKLIDLSPLAGIKLVSLDCYCNPRLADLLPLREMPLTTLRCNNTQIADLSPLQGMKLTILNLVATQVIDIASLQGIKLRELSISYTPVSDLSPLQGIPVVNLGISNTRVSDLSPLAGTSLTELYFNPKTITKGFDILRQMKSLTTIDIGGGNKLSPVEFWKKYDAGEFGKVLDKIDDPAFQAWMKDVQALPAEQQVEAVRKKLMELNPGFDGQVIGFDGKPNVTTEAGVVTEFGIVTDEVTDISPVGALVGLKSLTCGGSGSGRTGKLSDLSPLQGLKLTKLHFFNTAVSNLTPLQKMPLTRLACNKTPVSDLLPLKKMPLSILNCDSTLVSDLSPLESCLDLLNIKCHNTKVTSATVAALQKVLPNCKIDWDDPAKATAPVIPSTK